MSLVALFPEPRLQAQDALFEFGDDLTLMTSSLVELDERIDQLLVRDGCQLRLDAPALDDRAGQFLQPTERRREALMVVGSGSQLGQSFEQHGQAMIGDERVREIVDRGGDGLDHPFGELGMDGLGLLGHGDRS